MSTWHDFSLVKQAAKRDKGTYAFGLLPMKKRKMEITRPAMRNWLTALKYLIPVIPNAVFSKDDVRMT